MYDESIGRVKSSFESFKAVNKLSKRNSAGALDGKQAKQLDIKAQKLRQNPFILGGIVGSNARIGYENVLDIIIDKPICFCGKTNCKVKFLNIPESTLQRFYDEDFSCSRIIDCVKANQQSYFERDTVIFNIKFLGLELKRIQFEIKESQNLINGFRIISEKVSVNPFIKRKKSSFHHNKNIGYPVYKKFLEMQNKIDSLQTAFDEGNRLCNCLKDKLAKAKARFSYYFSQFRIRYIGHSKTESKTRKVYTKIVSRKQSINLTPEILANAKMNLINLRLEFNQYKSEFDSISNYKIPSILTLDQQNKLELNASKLKGKKAKTALHKVRLTNEFLSNYINANLV